MNWKIEDKEYKKEKIEFIGNKMCIGNGYFGYRGTLEEYGKEQLVACTVSEIFDDNGNGWREPVNVPNGLYTWVEYEEKKLSVLETKIEKHVQELHFDTGIHRRKTVFSTEDGQRITVEAERFASLEDIHLLVMRYQVTADKDLDIKIHTGIDDDIWNINGNHFKNKEYIEKDGVTGMICKTIENTANIAVSEKKQALSPEGKTENLKNGSVIHVNLKKSVPYVMEKYIAICKETDCTDVWEAAVNCCQQAEQKGYDRLKAKQKALWGKRYEKLGIEIEGDEEAEKAVLYSAYLLYSSAPEHTDRVAIPARGLSGQVYKGAMFWDTEIYMLPMFAFCDPKIARNLVMYRVKNLQGAYEKASEYGYEGAFYPWESQETGRDGCTHYNLTDIFTGRKMRTYFRDKQIHISADVVYGLWKYMNITKDNSILKEGAAEVILECARFFWSYAYYKKGKEQYEFLDVTGADEYHERVNNDAYTNYMIRLTAKATLDVISYLKSKEPEMYKKVMDKLDYWKEEENIRDLYEKIYLPKPNDSLVIEQFDGYLKEEDLSIQELYSRIIKPNEYLGSPCGLAVNTQIIKQADVILLLSLLGSDFTDEVKEKNWSYYEPRTEHGSSLSTCIYALLAAQIGKTEWAYQYLMKAAQIDLTGDYKLYLGDLYIGGTHPAANGGTWMVLTQGFAGLEAEEDGVHFSPHLPEKWRKLKFRFNYGGSRYRVEITKDILKIIGEDAAKELRVTYMGNIYTCSAGSTLKIQMENREGK